MPLHARTTRALTTAALTAAVVAVAVPASAAKPACGKRSTCSSPPVVAFTSPAAGSSLAGAVTLTGDASSGVGLASVQTSVDGGSWTTATGTTSWSSSLDTRPYADGAHTLYAKATDTTGATTTAALSVSFANTAPTVSIASPATGSTVSGSLVVSGSATGANTVSRVDVQVDGGSWQPASGTTSWSWTWTTTGITNGMHTLTARATDSAGSTATSSSTVTVSNTTSDTTAPTVAISSPSNGATVTGTTTVAGSASDNVSVAKVEIQVDGGSWQLVSGTTSWSYSLATTAYLNGSHTISARATDGAGNATTATITVNVSNSSTAPDTQGSWTSPEGVQINVNTAGPWTIRQVYSILTANAYELDKVGPTLTIQVQDTYASQTASGAGTVNGVYANFSATIYLKGVSSTFASYPDAQETHEYGHAWTMYHYYLQQQAIWTSYLNERWSSADGSVTLATDSRTGTSYTWNQAEIIADDYRLLFGTTAAQQLADLNPYIVDPRQQPGLKDWLVKHWATGT